jgi:hypothetical protein
MLARATCRRGLAAATTRAMSTEVATAGSSAASEPLHNYSPVQRVEASAAVKFKQSECSLPIRHQHKRLHLEPAARRQPEGVVRP